MCEGKSGSNFIDTDDALGTKKLTPLGRTDANWTQSPDGDGVTGLHPSIDDAVVAGREDVREEQSGLVWDGGRDDEAVDIAERHLG